MREDALARCPKVNVARLQDMPFFKTFHRHRGFREDLPVLNFALVYFLLGAQRFFQQADIGDHSFPLCRQHRGFVVRALVVPVEGNMLFYNPASHGHGRDGNKVAAFMA